MTRLKPSLLLSRLLVSAHGEIVYDQVFHSGVNIIRGTNSHGKSSIAEFIFFVLGGDVHKWKLEASSCDFVWAEVMANGATLTLKRTVTTARGQGMSIFFGPYEQARASAVEGWQVFPYKRTSDTESFSQTLFRALGMPETRGEASGHITIHQLLRLIYIDQITPPDALMRSEEFDSPLTRRTVVDYLLGVYDNTLYQKQLDYREGKRRQDDLKEQLKQLETVLDRAEIETDPRTLAEHIAKANAELSQIDQELAVLQKAQTAVQVAQRSELAPLTDKLGEKRKEAYVLNNETRDVSLEIEDSSQFIAALESRLASLDDAATTREVIGSLPLLFCPQCLSPLTPTEQQNVCTLCKQPSDAEITKTHAARMRQELALQIKESKTLLTAKEAKFAEKRSLLTQVTNEVQTLQKEYERLAAMVQTARDSKIDRLLVAKGSLERSVGDLLQKNKIIQVLLGLREQEKVLAASLQALAISINQRLSDQKAHYYEALAMVQKYTLHMLHRDLQLEERFKLARNVELAPETNTFGVDGRNQFSASSMTYLKNSIHFALLFASMELSFSRYPRLIICDNIEDKGMTTERSRNFQRNIVALSQASSVEHQIVFTTSMVDPSLDTPEFTVGPNYVDGLKTLRIKPTVIPATKT